MHHVLHHVLHHWLQMSGSMAQCFKKGDQCDQYEAKWEEFMEGKRSKFQQMEQKVAPKWVLVWCYVSPLLYPDPDSEFVNSKPFCMMLASLRGNQVLQASEVIMLCRPQR